MRVCYLISTCIEFINQFDLIIFEDLFFSFYSHIYSVSHKILPKQNNCFLLFLWKFQKHVDFVFKGAILKINYHPLLGRRTLTKTLNRNMGHVTHFANLICFLSKKFQTFVLFLKIRHSIQPFALFMFIIVVVLLIFVCWDGTV